LSATVAALVGIAPDDELEGMVAAQLVASHNAAMECYRRAMIGDQTFEGRRENLSQANKLSRTHATLLEALNRHRGKGQQKVTVEHVHVHSGGQAIVGAVKQKEGGGVAREHEGQPHAKAIFHAPQRAVVRRREPRPNAGPQRCRTAVAGCTEGSRRVPQSERRTVTFVMACSRATPLRAGAN
jgi:hypothetical protein